MKKLLGQFIPRLYGGYFNFLALFYPKLAAEKAFTLFCTPRKGKVLEIQSSFLDAAKHKSLEVGGMCLQTYIWPGKRETVLLLHGWESNSFRWKNLIEHLIEADFNVLAFDAPAHGGSTGKIFNVPLYAECTDRIIGEFNPTYIVAHSVGGTAAVYHQYQYGQGSVKKLVTIGSPSELEEIMAHYQDMLKFNNRVLNALDKYFQNHFGFGIEGFSTSKFASELLLEGLLIHDELDKIAPVTSSERVHANWKNSRLVLTRGLGHSLHQREINLQIVDFLKSAI
ncbi:MAG: alpha/beta hydrolase [Flavobacteriaceae bacterium]